MFIEKTDLLSAIRSEELNQITRMDDEIINYGISAAISEIISYLSGTYDVNSIFAQIGSNRNALLLNFAVDISVYIILSNAYPGQNMEDRRLRYKRAQDWLEKLAKGEINSDLPKITVTNQVTSRGYTSTHNKRNNYL